MKIALVLRGHYRSFDTTSKTWLNGLKGLDYDCYFHTWDLQDSTTPTWHRGEKYALPLYPSNIELLKKFDKDIVIEDQVFTQEDHKDITLSAPYKAYMYRYESLRDTLNRIPENKYDLIIVGRYDILITNQGCFKTLNISDDEIFIGAAVASDYYKSIRATDLLFAFHPKYIKLFTINPYTRHCLFPRGEEPFTDFLFKNFKKVTIKWEYEKDFIIKR